MYVCYFILGSVITVALRFVNTIVWSTKRPETRRNPFVSCRSSNGEVQCEPRVIGEVMAELWTVIVVLFTLIEKISPEDMTDPPLTKSLGFAIQKRFSKTLEDAHLNQEYMYQYHEMLRASQESFENFASRDERRQRRVVGDRNYEFAKEGAKDRRRNALRFQSAVGRRRAKTQALRRQKLNSQSLRSHLQHSRQTTADYNE